MLSVRISEDLLEKKFNKKSTTFLDRAFILFELMKIPHFTWDKLFDCAQPDIKKRHKEAPHFCEAFHYLLWF